MPRRHKFYFPSRNGLGPQKVVITQQWIGSTLDSALTSILCRPAEEIKKAFSQGDIYDRSGVPLSSSMLIEEITPVYIYSDPQPETVVPYPIEIIYETDEFLVVDKPHFLSTMPRGMHITETALTRVRRMSGNDMLVPAHRLDRLTAGVLLFIKHPKDRGTYQQLFSKRKIKKTYHCLTQMINSPINLPLKIVSTITKIPGTLTASNDITGNTAITILKSIRKNNSLTECVVEPVTGKTHQIRIHLAQIGYPILNDPLYNQENLYNQNNFDSPLALIAKELTFTDPVTGVDHSISTNRNFDDTSSIYF